MNTITCPKCGHQQVKAADCLKCGIVFDKFQEKNKKSIHNQYSDVHQKASLPGSGGISPGHTRKGPNPANHLTQHIHGLKEKTRRFRDELFQLIVRIVLTYVFFTGLFWLTKGTWFLYGETHMGNIYRTYFIKKAHFTSELLSLSPLKASFEITLLALLSCLLIGLIPTLTLFPASFSLTAYMFPELTSFIPGKRRIFDH